MTDGPDRWHWWLLDVRFGGDAAARQQDLTTYLYPVRDIVLDRARLQPGGTLLDVGAGDGLIAFGALEPLGLGQVLTPEEFTEFTGWLRPLVEAGKGRDRKAMSYLTAVKE